MGTSGEGALVVHVLVVSVNLYVIMSAPRTLPDVSGTVEPPETYQRLPMVDPFSPIRSVESGKFAPAQAHAQSSERHQNGHVPQQRMGGSLERGQCRASAGPVPDPEGRASAGPVPGQCRTRDGPVPGQCRTWDGPVPYEGRASAGPVPGQGRASAIPDTHESVDAS